MHENGTWLHWTLFRAALSFPLREMALFHHHRVRLVQGPILSEYTPPFRLEKLIFEERNKSNDFRNPCKTKVKTTFTDAYKKNYSNILINHDWFTSIISLPADNPDPSSCGVCAARFRCRGFHNRIRHLDPRIQPGQRPESGDRLDRKPGFTHCADGFWFAEDYTCCGGEVSFCFTRSGREGRKGKEREERGRTRETDTTYETHVQRSMMTKTHCTEVDSILWRGDERVMSERRWCEVYTLSIIMLPHQLSCCFILQSFNAGRCTR